MNTSQIAVYLADAVFAISTGWYTPDVAKQKITVVIATFLMLTIINMSQLIALINDSVQRVAPFTTSVLSLLY